MVKQTSVKSAYHKVGDPNTRRGGDCWSRCKSICCFLVVGFILVSLAGSGSSQTTQKQNLRPISKPSSSSGSYGDGASSGGFNSGGDGDGTGTSSYGGSSSSSSSSSSSYSSGNTNGYGSYDKVHETLYQAEDNIAEIAEEEVENEKGILASAVSKLGTSIYNGIAGILGGSVSNDELQDIVNEVQEELRADSVAELEDAAFDIAQNALENMDEQEEVDEGSGKSAEDIVRDIARGETDAIVTVVRGIDDVERDIESSMSDKALEIEKKILEDRLSKKLGRPVEIRIKDNVLEGDEDLLAGLPNLTGGSGSFSGTDPFGYNSGSKGNSNGYSGGNGDNAGNGGYYNGESVAGGQTGNVSEGNSDTNTYGSNVVGSDPSGGDDSPGSNGSDSWSDSSNSSGQAQDEGETTRGADNGSSQPTEDSSTVPVKKKSWWGGGRV